MKFVLNIIFMVLLLGVLCTSDAAADIIPPSEECSLAVRDYSILAYTGSNEFLFDGLIEKGCIEDVQPYTEKVLFNPFQYRCITKEEELRDYVEELKARVSHVRFKRLLFLKSYREKINTKIKILIKKNEFLYEKRQKLRSKIASSKKRKTKNRFRKLVNLNKERVLINLLNRKSLEIDQEANSFELNEETNFLARQYKKSAYDYISVVFSLSSMGCIRFPEEILQDNTFFELFTNKYYIPKRGPLENILYDDVDLYKWSFITYKEMF